MYAGLPITPVTTVACWRMRLLAMPKSRTFTVPTSEMTIVGRDVSVHDAQRFAVVTNELVGPRQAAAGVGDELGGEQRWHERVEAADQLEQAWPLDELHHHVEHVHRNEIWMHEAGGKARLVDKQAERVFIAQQ